MPTGTVQFFDHAKGFGFIKDEETQEPMFVHTTNLVDNIRDNDRVTYDVGENKKGPAAVNVKLAK